MTTLAEFAARFNAGQAPAVDVDVNARTITGLSVPYGRPGQTGMGRLSFRQGGLAVPAETSRVKLLREHDQGGDVVGHATELLDDPAGMFARFKVDEGAAGDEALRSARAKMRDGLSIGVELDDATQERLRQQRAKGGVAVASGSLREVSLVAVPAFDDARVAASASLVTFTAEATSSPTTEGHNMTDQPTSSTATDPTQAGPSTQPDQPTSGTGTPPARVDNRPAGNQPDTATDRPAVVEAAAGMGLTTVTGEPATYTFGADGSIGHSLMRDAFVAQVDGDRDAAARMSKFNAELAAGNPASIMAVAAVAGTTDVPGTFNPTQYRPDLMVRAIDAGRPIVSRLHRTPISNAQPFNIPVEGDFTGIGDHTEKTAVNAPGTLALGEATVSPKAVSGSYELTRELIDSSNPAVDQIALRGMLKDYRRLSEDKVIAALVAADAALDVNIDKVMELDAILEEFVDDDGQGADFVAAGRAFLRAMRADVDADQRPMLAPVNPTNAPGTASGAGASRYEIGGVPLVRAPRLTTDHAVIVRADGVLFAESATQQFRFEQPKGPGVIILALWGYVGAKVLRAADVRRITKAAA